MYYTHFNVYTLEDNTLGNKRRICSEYGLEWWKSLIIESRQNTCVIDYNLSKVF